MLATNFCTTFPHTESGEDPAILFFPARKLGKHCAGSPKKNWVWRERAPSFRRRRRREPEGESRAGLLLLAWVGGSAWIASSLRPAEALAWDCRRHDRGGGARKEQQSGKSGGRAGSGSVYAGPKLSKVEKVCAVKSFLQIFVNSVSRIRCQSCLRFSAASFAKQDFCFAQISSRDRELR